MDRAQLVVVGAGAGGASAAIEAAEAGLQVTLIDENPIGMSMMALEVPLFFGQRFTPTVQDRALMLQRVVSSNPLLGRAEEVGVNVLLGTYVWGSFRNEENSQRLKNPALGLAAEGRSWLLEYDRLILATGARDLVLSFPGWDKQGVMGSLAAQSLMTRYQALASRRIVVLGSGDLGLHTASMALDRGIEVAAIVDVSPGARGNRALIDGLAANGVPFYTSHTVLEARGDQGVTSVILTGVDGSLEPVAGSEKEIECDTIVLAIGAAPSLELPYLTGCSLSFKPGLGGFVPDADEEMRAGAEGVFVVGDAAGVHEGMATNPDLAMAQGRSAAIAAAESLGTLDGAGARARRAELPSPLSPSESDGGCDYWNSWLSSLINAGGLDVTLCQCEDVSRRDIIDLAPPAYLEWDAKRAEPEKIRRLAKDGPASPDQVKRLTRACMGYCQGRRCRDQVAMLVARATGADVSQLPLASYRPPVRPLPLGIMSPDDEPPEVWETWSEWFGHSSGDFLQAHV